MMFCKTSQCIISSVAILQGLLLTSRTVEAIQPSRKRETAKTELTGDLSLRQLKGKRKMQKAPKKIGKKSRGSIVVADSVGLARCKAENKLDFNGRCACNAVDNGFVLDCPAICEFCRADSTVCGAQNFRRFYQAEGESFTTFIDFDYTEGRDESVSFGTSFNCAMDGTCDSPVSVNECEFVIDGTACASCNRRAACGGGAGTNLQINCENIEVGVVLDLCTSTTARGTVFEAIFPDSGDFEDCTPLPVSKPRKSKGKKSVDCESR